MNCWWCETLKGDTEAAKRYDGEYCKPHYAVLRLSLAAMDGAKTEPSLYAIAALAVLAAERVVA